MKKVRRNNSKHQPFTGFIFDFISKPGIESTDLSRDDHHYHLPIYQNEIRTEFPQRAYTLQMHTDLTNQVLTSGFAQQPPPQLA